MIPPREPGYSSSWVLSSSSVGSCSSGAMAACIACSWVSGMFAPFRSLSGCLSGCQHHAQVAQSFAISPIRVIPANSGFFVLDLALQSQKFLAIFRPGQPRPTPKFALYPIRLSQCWVAATSSLPQIGDKWGLCFGVRMSPVWVRTMSPKRGTRGTYVRPRIHPYRGHGRTPYPLGFPPKGGHVRTDPRCTTFSTKHPDYVHICTYLLTSARSLICTYGDRALPQA